MGLFGSGQLRRQIQSLADEMESIRRELIATKNENGELKKQVAEREDALKGSKESKKKLEKKLEKIASARTSADKKSSEQAERIQTLQSEVQDYRKQLIKTRDELDRLQGKAAQGEPKATIKRDDTADTADEAAPVREFQPDPEREARRIDRRVERLEEQLEQEKSGRFELKDRLTRAEQTARDADRRRISELNKAEAVVRDLQHSIRSERRAYKILQLQYEAQLERARAAEANVTNAPTAIQPESAEGELQPEAPESSIQAEVAVEIPNEEVSETPAVDNAETETAPDAEPETASVAEPPPETEDKAESVNADTEAETAGTDDKSEDAVKTEAPVDVVEQPESAES